MEGEIQLFQILGKKVLQRDEFQEVRGSFFFPANTFFHTYPKGNSLTRKFKVQTRILCIIPLPGRGTNKLIHLTTKICPPEIFKPVGNDYEKNSEVGQDQGALTWRNLNLIRFIKSYFIPSYHQVPQHMTDCRSRSWRKIPQNICQIFTRHTMFLALGKTRVIQASALPGWSRHSSEGHWYEIKNKSDYIREWWMLWRK